MIIMEILSQILVFEELQVHGGNLKFHFVYKIVNIKFIIILARRLGRQQKACKKREEEGETVEKFLFKKINSDSSTKIIRYILGFFVILAVEDRLLLRVRVLDVTKQDEELVEKNK